MLKFGNMNYKIMSKQEAMGVLRHYTEYIKGTHRELPNPAQVREALEIAINNLDTRSKPHKY
tara:strand:+ start:3559 stop:3744 length:186 start_codon:yes stop_codon:yes gene_type:complete